MRDIHLIRNIWYKKFHEGTIIELDRVLEVDLKGSVRLCRAVIPIMLQNTTTIIIIEIKMRMRAKWKEG